MPDSVKNRIPPLKPEQRLTREARRILRKRLRTVSYYLPLAAKKPSKSTEYVHQLRVATRRAGAALKIFADLLPKREWRYVNEMLQRLRAAAGDARDLDVLKERLRKMAKQQPDLCFKDLKKEIATCRKRAQLPLLHRYRSAKAQHFRRRARALSRAVSWPDASPEPTLILAAKDRLAPIAERFFAAANADLAEPAALHYLRIRGKQLRYALEILGGAFDESHTTEVYTAITHVQEKLGAINDLVTASAKFTQWKEQAGSEDMKNILTELIARQDEQQRVLSAEFRSWWTESRAIELTRAIGAILATSPTAAR